jgi:hypothetical protein
MKKKMIKCMVAVAMLTALPMVSQAQTKTKDGRSFSTTKAVQLKKASEVIGLGFDVSGFYARSEYLKKPRILDFNKLNAAGLVKNDPSATGFRRVEVSGNSASQYAEDMQNKAGVKVSVGVRGFGGFKSDINATFSSERTGSENYAFASIKTEIVNYAYYVANNNLSNYFTDDFVRDVKSLSGDAIVEKYGTHLLLGGKFGGVVETSISARKSSSTSKASSLLTTATSAQVSLGIVSGSADVNTSNSSNSSSANQFSEQKMSTEARGGKSSTGFKIATKGDYTAWIASVDAGKEIWCGYYGESNVQLDKLLDGTNLASYKSKITAAIDKYLAGKVITVTTQVVSGTATKHVSAKGAQYVHKLKYGEGAAAVENKGDLEMGSKSGKTNTWDIAVEVSLDPKNPNLLLAKFTYVVHEGGGGSKPTELEMVYTEKINVSGADISLASSNLQWTYNGKVVGVNEKLVPVTIESSQACPWLKNLKVQVDGKGDDDKNIGFDCDLAIPYRYSK